jgi:hypothetical protein
VDDVSSAALLIADAHTLVAEPVKKRGRHICVSLSGNGPNPYSSGCCRKRTRSSLVLQRLGAEEAGGAEDAAAWPTTKNSSDFPLTLNFILLLSRVNWTAVFSGMKV